MIQKTNWNDAILPKLQDGAPIVGLDNVVELRNGRTLAITKAYESGKADNYRAEIEGADCR